MKTHSLVTGCFTAAAFLLAASPVWAQGDFSDASMPPPPPQDGRGGGPGGPGGLRPPSQKELDAN
jgi:hypothetical protein